MMLFPAFADRTVLSCRRGSLGRSACGEVTTSVARQSSLRCRITSRCPAQHMDSLPNSRSTRLTCTAESQTAAYNPYLSKRYDLFISHRGPESKSDVALPLREKLQSRGLTAFVDEADLRPGGDAARNMERAVQSCKVAVVLFSSDFWDSSWCVKELRQVLDLARDQRLVYLPVFMFQTKDEVQDAARDLSGKAFAIEVCSPTGIRHKGEILNGSNKTKEQTIEHIFREVVLLPGCAGIEVPELCPTGQWPAMNKIYTYVLGATPGCRWHLELKDHLTEQLGPEVDVVVKYEPQRAVEIKEKGCCMSRLTQEKVRMHKHRESGVVGIVTCATTIGLNTGSFTAKREYIIVHGCDMLAQPGTSLCYRFSSQPQHLLPLHPMHPDHLTAVSALLAPQDSVAVSIPSLHQCASQTIILEAWQGLRPVGNAVHIPVSTLLLGAPLPEREQQAIQEQPGYYDWAADAAGMQQGQSYTWDVLVVHAGNTDYPFAAALELALQGTGWGLKVARSNINLVSTATAEEELLKAIEATHVAVLLVSPRVFERQAADAELGLLLNQYQQRNIQLLPVFLHLTPEECHQHLQGLLGRGYGLRHPPTGIRHHGQRSTIQPNMPKSDRETLWQTVHALSVLLRKDFKAGAASYGE